MSRTSRLTVLAILFSVFTLPALQKGFDGLTKVASDPTLPPCMPTQVCRPVVQIVD
jgi:hypothetical protein